VGSGIKEKYIFQKMGFPFRQMHSWDYSGPYHGYDGFAVFARDMDMTLNNPSWSQLTAPWLKPPENVCLNGLYPSVHRFVAREERIMSQNVEKTKACYPLFEQAEYQALFTSKRELEEAHGEARSRKCLPGPLPRSIRILISSAKR